VVVFFQMSAKQLAAVLRDLAICYQGVKSETKSSSNSDEIPGSPKGMGIVQEYNDQHSFYY
jgi:hypothetical protein